MRTLLFYSKTPMNYVMFRPVAEELARDGRIDLRVRGETEDGSDPVSAYGALGVEGTRLVGRLRCQLTAYDLYVSADYRIAARRAARKVHVFHGISFKGKAYMDHILRYDRAFLIGPYQRRMFAKRGIMPPDDPRMVDVGMPKTDALVDGTLRRDEVLRSLGIDPATKVVLYAPTWRRESSLNLMGEEILRAVGGMKGITLVVKVHDLCMNPRTNARDWGGWLAAQERAGAPWKWARNLDATPLLAAADLLVSDASSVANEFLLLDRPVVFMDVPALMAKYADHIDLETWGRKTGTVVVSPAELPACIEGELADPGRLSEVRRAAAADYFYHPGAARMASVREIQRILGLEPLHTTS